MKTLEDFIPEGNNIIATFKSVSELSEIVLGGTPSTSIQEYWNGEILWASAKDISNNEGRYIYSTERKITQLGIQNSSAKICPAGTIVITSRGTVGKMTILPFEMSFNQTCYGLIARENTSYLYLYYSLIYSLQNIESLTYGTVFDTITIKTFDDLFLPYPDEKTRKTITTILDILDSKIELNSNINSTLESLAKSLFHSWFIRFEPFQNGEFVDSELGLIPKGWKVIRLKEIVETQNGKKPVNKEDTLNNIHRYPVYTGSGIIGYTREYLYDYPVIVTGRVGTLGLVHRITHNCWASDNTIVILSVNKSDYHYVYHLLQKADLARFNRGSSNPLIVQSDIKELLLAYPAGDINIINDFNHIMMELYKKIDHTISENLLLSSLHALLLPQLLSGKLRINDPEQFLEEIIQ